MFDKFAIELTTFRKMYRLGDKLKVNLRFESFVNSIRCQTDKLAAYEDAGLRALLIRKGVKHPPFHKRSGHSLRALLYELRLNFANGEKTEYTKEEILAKLDEIALGAD